MQPPVVHQITHFPVPRHFKTDFSTSRQPIIWVVLEVFVSISILPNAFSVLALVLQFFPHVSHSNNMYLPQPKNTCKKDCVPTLRCKYLWIRESVPQKVSEAAWFEDCPEFDHIIIWVDYVLLHPALRAGYQDSFILKGKHFPYKQVVPLFRCRYTDPNLYFQIYNKDNLLPSGTNDCININNYRESLF